MKKYDNLTHLIKCSYAAREYFYALPENTADLARENGEKIRTHTELLDFTERTIHEFV